MGSKRKRQSTSTKINPENKNDEENATLEDFSNEENAQGKYSKRNYMDDEDHDSDESPKKAKKKKKAIQPDTTEKKGKKSIRQMKKEKHAQRQADAEAAAKDQLKSQCVNYLSQWKYDRQNWKFMKAKQVWLYKNKFSVNLVPNESWQTFLEYFESAKGNIRNMLLEDSNKIIKQMDEWSESQQDDSEPKEDEETAKVQKPDDTVYSRARSLIQCLGE